jgi:hypothetical protein
LLLKRAREKGGDKKKPKPRGFGQIQTQELIMKKQQRNKSLKQV